MPDKDPRGDMSSYLQNLVKKVVKSGFNVDRRDSAAVYNNSDFVEKARNFLTWTYIGEPAFRRHLENLIDSDTKIFDGGSAGGRVSLLFTEMGADPHNIVGVEIAEAQVEKARIVLPGADFRVGSVADPLPEVDYFDIAVSNMVTEFLDKATFESALRSMYSAMKPGGTGVFITTHPDRFTKKHGVTEEGYFKSS
ncbi:MAG: class I SAM-dependent methyltransferase, partial [Candidatus Amesbacteria bacterium]|nr:class I SAM-dependent methyltransferase [Candidatus Amesbacteria bacterium]